MLHHPSPLVCMGDEFARESENERESRKKKRQKDKRENAKRENRRKTACHTHTKVEHTRPLVLSEL